MRAWARPSVLHPQMKAQLGTFLETLTLIPERPKHHTGDQEAMRPYPSQSKVTLQVPGRPPLRARLHVGQVCVFLLTFGSQVSKLPNKLCEGLSSDLIHLEAY